MMAIHSFVAVAAVVCLAFAVAGASAEDFSSCRLEVLETLVQANSDDVRCAALQRYYACLTSIGADSTMLASVDNYLNGITCDVTAEPDLALLSAYPLLQTDRTYQRLRRETTSLLNLTAEVVELEQWVENAATEEDIAYAARIADSVATTDDAWARVNARLTVQEVAFDGATTDVLSSALDRLQTVEDGIANTANRTLLNQAKVRVVNEVGGFTVDVDNAILEQSIEYSLEISRTTDDMNDFRLQKNDVFDSVTSIIGTLSSETSTARYWSDNTADTLEGGVASQLTRVSTLNAAHSSFVDAMTASASTLNAITAFQSHRYMWSGYCSHHGNANNNWARYCTDRVEWNTGNDYFRVSNAGNGEFTATVAGYYRINAWAITHASSWAFAAMYVNGVLRYHGHEYAQGTWTDNFLDQTWPMQAGDVFWVQYYRGGGSWNYHSGNANGAHSRIQITYLRPL